MENILIFTSEKEVRFRKLLQFIIPTYLTSLKKHPFCWKSNIQDVFIIL